MISNPIEDLYKKLTDKRTLPQQKTSHANFQGLVHFLRSTQTDSTLTINLLVFSHVLTFVTCVFIPTLTALLFRNFTNFAKGNPAKINQNMQIAKVSTCKNFENFCELEYSRIFWNSYKWIACGFVAES